MILFFSTEWEARAFYLEIELMESQGHLQGERPKATMELRLYQTMHWVESRTWIKFGIAAVIGALAGLLLGYNI